MNKGFTLIELTIIVLIIGILVSIVISVINYNEKKEPVKVESETILQGK